MADIQNMELFQTIGERERELSLLRDDLKAANARNEELRAELKAVKAQRDHLQTNMELFQEIGQSERELSLLRDDLKASNAMNEDLRAEVRDLKAALENKNSAAIVNGAARSDLEEKLKMSAFQNRKLQEENEYLKYKLDRLESETPSRVQAEPSAEKDSDNPFEYHVSHLRSVLYREEYFPENMRFEDYDFGHIVVGEPACLRGSISVSFDKDDWFEFSGNDIYRLSLMATSRNYKYVSIDKENKSAVVEYDSAVDNGRTLRMYKKTMPVPLTACLNLEEVVRWRDDYMQYEIEKKRAQEPEPPKKRSFFKRR